MSDAAAWAAVLTAVAALLGAPAIVLIVQAVVRRWRRVPAVPPLSLPGAPPPKSDPPATPRPSAEQEEVMRLRDEIAEVRTTFLLRVADLQERVGRLEEIARRNE